MSSRSDSTDYNLYEAIDIILDKTTFLDFVHRLRL
jgi:hypothetical protein